MNGKFESLIDGFNPRIRKGCDCFNAAAYGAAAGFNPRIRKGCDSPHPAE